MGFLDGDRKCAKFNFPRGLAYDEVDQSLIVCDLNNHKLRRVSLISGMNPTLS